MDLFPKILNSPKALAKHLGKSSRTIRRWIKAGIPQLSDGRFDVGQVQTWIEGRQGLITGALAIPKDQDPGAAREGGKDHWDKEGKKYQAKSRELEYRRRLGELIERSEVESLFVSRVLAVKQGLLNLSRALPPLLAACQNEREMEAIIAGKVRELLEEFARPLPINLQALESPGGKGKSD